MRLRKLHKDNDLIKGIQHQDDRVLESMYDDFFPIIENFVLHNSGDNQDAHDVFQDGIIIVYRKIMSGKLELTSSFLTYFYAVCKNIWFKQLFNRKDYIDKLAMFNDYENIPNVNTDEYELHEEYKLYQSYFSKLHKDCQKLLSLFMKKISLKDIANKMGIESVQYAKRKKYKCKEQLVRNIRKDPKYIERYDD